MRAKRHVDPVLTGRGMLRKGNLVGQAVYYTVHVNPSNGQASVVEFEPKPVGRDGDLVRLTLEDGRVLNCHILDNSPYCAVVGDGPIVERRRRPRSH